MCAMLLGLRIPLLYCLAAVLNRKAQFWLWLACSMKMESGHTGFGECGSCWVNLKYLGKRPFTCWWKPVMSADCYWSCTSITIREASPINIGCTLSTVYAHQGLMYSWHAYIILIGKPMQLVPHSVHCTVPFIGSLDQRQSIGTFLTVFVPGYKDESSFVNVRLNLRILIFFALMSMCCFSVNIFICSLLH